MLRLTGFHRDIPDVHVVSLGTQRCIIVLAILLLTGIAPAAAQDKNKVSNFIRDALASRNKEIMAAALQMPADKYGARISPEGMTFAQFTLHVAAANYQYCSAIGGMPEPKLPEVADTEPKDKLVERLKASFDFCSTALGKLDDSNKSEMLMIGETKTSRAMAILTLSGTWADHAVQQAEYLQVIQPLPTAKR